jgi:beta-glucosidase
MIFILLLFILPCIDSFFLGTATSSYQIEGQNKGQSIWDVYTLEKNLHPVGNATNYFQLYKQDIQLMSELGFRHYRFSISWTRIMPFEWNVVDPEGIQFYHNILDECKKYNITPYVTLYHWDLPHYITGGWLHPDIIFYFK